MHAHEAIVATAQHVLSTTYQSPVELGAPTQPEGGSGRAIVLRCAVNDGPAHLPKQVIIKATSRAGDGFAERHTGLLNEWASLAFLTHLAPDSTLAPRFLGGDRTESLVIMEDLGAGESLVQPLLGHDRQRAEAALDAYFRSLGQLNGMTCGHVAHYAQIRTALGADDRAAHPTFDETCAILTANLRHVADRLGGAISAAVAADVVEAARFDAAPGPFLAFSQSDTCPDNCMRSDAGMRFFDFEGGWFRHALTDGARARTNFPTCWCVGRLPDTVVQRTEAVYRAEFVKGCPAAADDMLFHRELVKACAYWTLYSFTFYQRFNMWDADAAWGTATVRQRVITRFEFLAHAAATFGQLEALGEQAHGFARALQQRWPETAPMPLYPAFAS